MVLPTYSDAKTALRSHSGAFRLTLSTDTNIKSFEVMPSLIITDATIKMGGEQQGLPPEVAQKKSITESLLNVIIFLLGRPASNTTIILLILR